MNIGRNLKKLGLFSLALAAFFAPACASAQIVTEALSSLSAGLSSGLKKTSDLSQEFSQNFSQKITGSITGVVEKIAKTDISKITSPIAAGYAGAVAGTSDIASQSASAWTDGVNQTLSSVYGYVVDKTSDLFSLFYAKKNSFSSASTTASSVSSRAAASKNNSANSAQSAVQAARGSSVAPSARASGDSAASLYPVVSSLLVRVGALEAVPRIASVNNIVNNYASAGGASFASAPVSYAGYAGGVSSESFTSLADSVGRVLDSFKSNTVMPAISTAISEALADYAPSSSTSTAPASLTSAIAAIAYSTSTGVLSLNPGYVIPLTASTSAWDASAASSSAFSAFYADPSSRISTGSGITWTGNSLSNTGVLSIGGLTGNISTSSLGISTEISTSTVRGMFSTNATGLSYNNSNGILSLASGYVIPTTASTTEWANKISSQWITSGSNVYYNTGNVGIGTTNPSTKLDVAGGLNVNGGTYDAGFGMTVLSNSNSNVSHGIKVLANNQSQYLGIGWGGIQSTYSIDINSGSGTDITLGSGRNTIISNGNLGIGTTTPGSKLTVVGNSVLGGNTKIGSSTVSSYSNEALLVQGGVTNGDVIARFQGGSNNSGAQFRTINFADFGGSYVGNPMLTFDNDNFFVKGTLQMPAYGATINLYQTTISSDAGNGTIISSGGSTALAGTNIRLGGDAIYQGNLNIRDGSNAIVARVTPAGGGYFSNSLSIGSTTSTAKFDVTTGGTRRFYLEDGGTGVNVRAPGGVLYTSYGNFDGNVAAPNYLLGGEYAMRQSGTAFILGSDSYFTQMQVPLETSFASNVGIGTSNPSARLDVAIATTTGTSIARFANNGTGFTFRNKASGGYVGAPSLDPDTGILFIDGSLALAENDNEASTNPTFSIGQLSVAGTGVIDISGGGKSMTVSSGASYQDAFTRLNLKSYRLGTDGGAAIQIDAVNATTSGRILDIMSGGVAKSAFDYAGNLGIGTTSPQAKLHIDNGALKISKSSSLQAVNPGWIIESADDTGAYNTFSSLYLYPDSNTSPRITFGKSGRQVALNMENVYQISSMPKFTTTDNMTWGFDGGSHVIGRYNDNIYYNSSGGSNAGAHIFVSSSSPSGPLSGTERMRITNTGNVGIGTSTPASNLTVVGAGHFTASLTAGGAGGTTTGTRIAITPGIINSFNGTESVPRWRIANSAISNGVGGIVFDSSISGISSSGGGIGQAVARTLSFYTGNGSALAERARFDTTGFFGIGTTTASHLFTVAGDVNITGAFRANGDAGTVGYVLQSNGSGAPTWVATSSLGISAGGGSGTVNSGTAGQVAFYASNGTAVTGTSTLFLTGENAGIGTTTPGSRLTVNGTTTALAFNMPATTAAGTGVFSIGSSRYLHAFGTRNVFAGQDAGNFTLSGATDNSAFGYQALDALTSGHSNTAVGGSALSGLTTGARNVAVGLSSMDQTTGAIDNVAVGYLTMRNSTGYENTALGAYAASGITSGLRNIAIGSTAGSNLTSGSYNIVIGYNTYLPSGTASNQLNIGNLIYGTGLDGTTSTLSSGNIGIGTTTPYAKLTVNGESYANNFTAGSSTATSTFAGGLNVGGGALTHNWSTGLTSIYNAALGAMTFDTDGGMISWIDMPVTSASSNGTVQSYSAQLDGNPVLTVYGTADGAGEVANLRVGIGTTTPSDPLTISGMGYAYSSTANVGFAAGYTGSGGRRYQMLSCYNCGSAGLGGFELYDSTASAARAYITAGVNGWQTPSDLRLKEEIETLSVLDRIDKVRGTSYKLKDSGILQIGVIAQEIKEAFPEAVSGEETEETYLGVSYNAIASIALQGVRELSDILGSVKDKIKHAMAWFSDSGDRFNVQGMVCVDEVCVTKDQFKQMLLKSGSVTYSLPAPAPQPEVETEIPDAAASSTASSTSTNNGSSDQAGDASSGSTPASMPVISPENTATAPTEPVTSGAETEETI